MGEYIDRKDLDFLNDFCIDSGKYAGLRLDEVFDELATADVIECSECELIRRQLSQAFDRIAELDKLNGELHSKIDKAIEEIEQTTNTYQGFLMHEGTKETILKILKEI